MKKIIVILAALLVATSLVACDNGKEQDTSPNIDIPTNAPEETPTEDDTPSVDRNFEEKNDVVYVMTPNGAANLRTDTNFDASSLSGISVKNGVELERIEADANWSKVTYEGENYFIANKIIVEKSVLDGFESVEKTIKIIVPSINVRYLLTTSTVSRTGSRLPRLMDWHFRLPLIGNMLFLMHLSILITSWVRSIQTSLSGAIATM